MRSKILLLCNSASGLYDFRGLLIQQLISNGNEVVALVPDGLKMELFNELGVRVIETPIDRRGVNPKTDLTLFLLYSKVFKIEKPNLIITYTIKPNIYGGLAAKRLGISYVANVTGLGTTFQKENLLKWLVSMMYKSSLKKAGTVFFENIGDRDTFLKNNIICSIEQTCVLNGAGVDIERFVYTEYPRDTLISFLYIGRLMKEKGVDELFCVMTRLRSENIPCKLVVLGDYEEDYELIIKEYSDEGWLDYKGYQNDVRPFIANSHCFVLPSWHEGMANTNLECAAMGRPVITSNIHGCLEAVENEVSGFLCNKRDVDDLYEKMKEFISLSYEERKAMGLAGRKRMEEMFDKREIVKKTINRLFGKD